MKRPLNTRQERFCEFLIAGETQTDAYLKAGFQVSKDVARRNAARLLTNADIKARVAELRKPHTQTALRRKEENLRFLASIIETPVRDIGPDSPLCLEYVEEFIPGGTPGKPGTIRRRIRKPDPLRAIEIYSKLLGHFEPDRVELESGPKTLQSIKERAAEVSSALAMRYSPMPREN